MARSFNGTTQYLTGAAPATTYPVSMHVRFASGLVPTGGATNFLMSLCRPTGGSDEFNIEYLDDGTIRVRATVFDAVGYRLNAIDVPLGLTVGTWHSILAVFTNNTTVDIYLDAVPGGNAASTTNPNPTAITDWTIGGLTYLGALYAPTNGSLAECAVWDAALNVNDAIMLTKGYSPLMVRPGNLVGYAPLIGRASPEIDVVGGNALTLVASPGTVAHPRVIAPHRRGVLLPAVQKLRPASTISSGTWLPSTGATLYGTVDEVGADDSDFDFTLGASTMELKFGSGTDPLVDTGHIIRYRIRGVGQMTVSLMQGASTIKSWTHNPVPSAFTTYEQTLTSGEASAISDYTDLRLRFVSA